MSVQEVSDVTSYNAAEIAEILGVAKVTVYKWVGERKIPHTRLGGRIVFTKDQISAWLKEHEVTELEKKERKDSAIRSYDAS